MPLFSRLQAGLLDFGQCAVDLAFPPGESAEAEPVPVERPFCEHCAEPYPAMQGGPARFLCPNCSQTEWSFAWARSGYRAEGQVLEAIAGFKYYDQFHFRPRLIFWLRETYDRHAGDQAWDALVPTPLHHRRARERGFNQAYELASALGKARKLPVLNCLHRCRETFTQASLSREDRLKNLKNTIAFKPEFDVQGLRLLLIDDVFTTGATVEACSQALASAGSAFQAVLTVARG